MMRTDLNPGSKREALAPIGVHARTLRARLSRVKPRQSLLFGTRDTGHELAQLELENGENDQARGAWAAAKPSSLASDVARLRSLHP